MVLSMCVNKLTLCVGTSALLGKLTVLTLEQSLVRKHDLWLIYGASARTPVVGLTVTCQYLNFLATIEFHSHYQRVFLRLATLITCVCVVLTDRLYILKKYDASV